MANVSEIIRGRYIRPLERPRTGLVGVELEFPIIHFGKVPVDTNIIQEMVSAFIEHFGFKSFKRDDNDRIFQAQDPRTGDDLSFDCSYNTLEFSFGAETDINTIYRRFTDYYNYIEDFLLPRQHTLTGLGINPHYMYNKNVPVSNGRYRMLFHHLSSYRQYPEKPCHDYPDFGMFSCASQVQLDVDMENVIPALNTFSRLEPFNSLLFANSYFKENGKRYYCSRDHFWRDSMQGYNLRNVDMYDTQFSTVDDIVRYIASESIYCLERDGKYINFKPTVLTDYFSTEIMRGEYWNGNGYSLIEFAPRPEDISFHRSYKFEDLTFRGTVELRSCCTQPAGDVMTVAAWFAGLMEMLPQLNILLGNDTSLYGRGYSPSQLRMMINTDGVPEFTDPEALSSQLLRLIDLAGTGLQKRRHGEEHFLSPLYERAISLTNPAIKMEELLANGAPADSIAEEYSKL